MTSTTRPEPESPRWDRASLRADCGNCFALCCTAFGFSRSADFPIDKPAGSPCHNLAEDFSCTVHASLRPRGFRGCTVFDCFGAGQNVSQRFFAGTSWREAPESASDMFSAFAAARQLHEMLWYLVEAGNRAFDPDLVAGTARLRAGIEHALDGDLDVLLAIDVQELHADVRALLIEVSEDVRAPYSAAGTDDRDAAVRAGADLMGRDLRALRLCGADLRGAYLIGADLRGSDLAGTDLLGADLRDARVDGADLSEALFLTQAQVNAASGSVTTRVPADLRAPAHW